jgi:hypothetical protein
VPWQRKRLFLSKCKGFVFSKAKALFCPRQRLCLFQGKGFVFPKAKAQPGPWQRLSVKLRFHRTINPKLISALFPIRVFPPRTLLAW